MATPEDNIEFLYMIQRNSEEAQEQILFLETLLEKQDANLPVVLKIKFAEIVSTIRVQDMLVRKLAEAIMHQEDKVAALVEKAITLQKEEETD
jgi:hypothetical protein